MHDWPSHKRINQYALVLLLLMLVITAKFIFENFLSDTDTARPARDFIAFWASSKLTLAGTPEVAYNMAALIAVMKEAVGYENGFAWLYPPTLQLLTAPLATIDYKWAYSAFMMASLALYLFSAVRLANDSRYTLGIIAFPPIYICIVYGQISLLTASLAMLGLHCMQRRPMLSGILIGLLAIKPQMAILFPIAMLAGRHWRAMAAAATTQITLITASLICFGIKPWHGFLASTGQARAWLEDGQLSWEKLISAFALSKMLGATTPQAYFIQGLVALAAIGVLAHVWRQTTNFQLRGSALILATLIATPYAYEYELVWLIIPLLLQTQYGLAHGWHKWQREILLLGWLTPLFNWAITIPAGQQPTPLALGVEVSMLASIMLALHRPDLLEKRS